MHKSVKNGLVQNDRPCLYINPHYNYMVVLLFGQEFRSLLCGNGTVGGGCNYLT